MIKTEAICQNVGLMAARRGSPRRQARHEGYVALSTFEGSRRGRGRRFKAAREGKMRQGGGSRAGVESARVKGAVAEGRSTIRRRELTGPSGVCLLPLVSSLRSPLDERRVQDTRAGRAGISLAGRKVGCKLLARTLVIITRSPQLCSGEMPVDPCVLLVLPPLLALRQRRRHFSSL